MTSLDGINGRSIQTLLRGENDSKQSDEFQAKENALIEIFFQIKKMNALTCFAVDLIKSEFNKYR